MATNRGTPGWYDDPYGDDQLRWFDGELDGAYGAGRPRCRTAGGDRSGHAVARLRQGCRDRSPPSGDVVLTATPPSPTNSSNEREVLPDGAVIAESWRRLVANFVDNTAVNALTFVVMLPFAGELPYPLGRPSGVALLLSVVVLILVSAVYRVGFLTWKQATPGKSMLGMVVRRVGDPGLSLTDALKRQILDAVGSAITLVDLSLVYITLVDGIWLLFNSTRQTLHDKMAGTVVVLTPDMARSLR